MDKIKSVFASRTIITNAVTLGASIATVWGLNLTPEQQAYAVTLIVTVGTIISSLFRIDATKVVVLSKPKTVQCSPVAVLLAGVIALSMAGCVSPGAVVGGYGAANAGLAAASPKLAEICIALEATVALADGHVTERHQATLDQADAAIATVCSRAPTSVPAAIATALAAYQAVQAARART